MKKIIRFLSGLFLTAVLLSALGCQLPGDNQNNNPAGFTGTGNNNAAPIAQVANNSGGPISQVKIGDTIFYENINGSPGSSTTFYNVPEGMNVITISPGNSLPPVTLGSLGMFSKGIMYTVNIRGSSNNYSAELWQRTNTNMSFNNDESKMFISSITGTAGNATGGTNGTSNALQIANEFILNIPAGAGPQSLATDGINIYLYHLDMFGSSATIYVIDPATGAITQTYPLNLFNSVPNSMKNINAIMWYNGKLWGCGSYVSSAGWPAQYQGIFSINFSTGLSEDQIPTGNGIDIGGGGLGGIACDGNYFYVAVDLSGSFQDLGIVKFSPASSSIPASPFFFISDLPRDITYGGGFFWYKNGGTYQKADQFTMKVIKEYNGAAGKGILFLNGKLWGIDNNKLISYTFQ